jgi:multiple sugar transport system ATP-binding protein
MSKVQFRDVNKVYENNVQAVFDFNLIVNDKEFIVLVGPSGCGKSTTLRMLAGLEDITEGEILIDDKVVNDIPPKNRDIAMVFQSYALYPHMTVFENMSFALKIKGLKKQEIEERVNHVADILALKPYLNRKPKALSGGQRQRVALGRAIVREPKVFLMDEPLSNLDAKLRVQMRSEITKIHQKVGAITIYVTHDQTEAMTMADRIVVMKDGYIQQIGTPKEVYNFPHNMFVGGFIGSPSMNFIDGKCDGNHFIISNNTYDDVVINLPNDMVKLLKNYRQTKINNLIEQIEIEKKEIGTIEFDLARNSLKKKDLETKKNILEDTKKSLLMHQTSLDEFNKGVYPLVIGIRPEDFLINSKESDSIRVHCDIYELLGKESIVYTYINGQRIVIVANVDILINQGEDFSIMLDFKKTHLFDKETTLRIR